ncbi:WD repeat-containing protein 91-like isoform X3 [Xenopus laevis]|uniref:WD repeat-containing protein 91-like isoform X3 n=1 Tax=Xenopus laevis TaxID=8355 RepID=A0A8J1MII2_XENLA|nr:WD repeat-containing protein 91-like isoform X3 [Xenopus laevis]
MALKMKPMKKVLKTKKERNLHRNLQLNTKQETQIRLAALQKATELQKTLAKIRTASPKLPREDLFWIPDNKKSHTCLRNEGIKDISNNIGGKDPVPDSKTAKSTEKKTESLDLDPDSRSDAQNEPVDSVSRGSGGSSARKEEKSSQPFIVLSQDEYAEHHSSIMHCRVDCSGCRVSSLDVDGVIKIWSIDGIIQTKASAISKSALLSLEWATKRDRLMGCKWTARQNCPNEDFFVPSAV